MQKSESDAQPDLLKTAVEVPEQFGSDPPSKFATNLQMLLIIAYYIVVNVVVFMMIYIKYIKDNWSLFQCSPTIMMTAWFFDVDTQTNFQQCIQNMQADYMDILLEPTNYVMSVASNAISSLTSALNNVREFMNNFRNKLTDSIKGIFGVFLNMLVQVQMMIIQMKDMISKIIGIMTTTMYTTDTAIKTMQSTWNGPIGEVVRAL